LDIFANPRFNIIGRKNIFLAVSGILLLVSIAAIWTRGIPFGVDFREGTIVYAKFSHPPDPDKIRAALQAQGITSARIQRYGEPGNNEVLIALDRQGSNEEALEAGREAITRALAKDIPAGKVDLNNVGLQALTDYLVERDPLAIGGDPARYRQIASAILDYRDRVKGGVLNSIDELAGAAPAAVISALKDRFVVSDFVIRNVEIVGPQVGEQLRTQAKWATLTALAGMLLYLWFRFELIYGAAAVAAVFHDAIVTLGLFSLLREEISLTVLAAFLTLIGYSMNDKIVIFDRIRENLKLMRRERYADLVNTSINQTLNRTFLTAGPLILTLIALYIFGGEVLQGFALALLVGIIVGTFSSFSSAALLVVYNERKNRRAQVAGVSAERQNVRA
jgi:preprotein translocase subunit SecF